MLKKLTELAGSRALGLFAVAVSGPEGEPVQQLWRPDERINLWSCAKTFCSLAVGICADQGLLSLEDRLGNFFPGRTLSPGSENIRIRDLLQMCSGKYLHPLPVNSDRQTDWLDLFLTYPVGEWKFFYSSFCTYALGRIVEQVSGETLRNFLNLRIFEPVGILNPRWDGDPHGHTVAAKDLFLNCQELSRLGRLLLDQGEYNGRRLVSSRYIQAMSEDTVDSADPFYPDDPEGRCGYGYQVWRCTWPGAYRAYGIPGNFCVVMPREGICITITADYRGNHNNILRAIFQAVEYL